MRNAAKVIVVSAMPNIPSIKIENPIENNNNNPLITAIVISMPFGIQFL